MINYGPMKIRLVCVRIYHLSTFLVYEMSNGQRVHNRMSTADLTPQDLIDFNSFRAEIIDNRFLNLSVWEAALAEMEI